MRPRAPVPDSLEHEALLRVLLSARRLAEDLAADPVRGQAVVVLRLLAKSEEQEEQQGRSRHHEEEDKHLCAERRHEFVEHVHVDAEPVRVDVGPVRPGAQPKGDVDVHGNGRQDSLPDDLRDGERHESEVVVWRH